MYMTKHKKCVFDKVNRCQKKDSAGHLGTIRSVKKKYCAKRINTATDRGNHFYNRNCPTKTKRKTKTKLKTRTRTRKICRHTPKYNGLCSDGKITYMVLEDLTRNKRNPWIMDIKIGHLSASYTQLKGQKRNLSSLKKLKYLSKMGRHILLSYITTSNKYGFRAASLSGIKNSIFIPNRINVGMTKPQKMLSVYFKHDKNNYALSNIIKELRKLNKFVHTKDFDEYSFIGSSILFVFDNTTHKRHNVSVNIIDFKRYRQSKKLSQNAKKYRNSFRIGVSNLLKEFIKYKMKT